MTHWIVEVLRGGRSPHPSSTVSTKPGIRGCPTFLATPMAICPPVGHPRDTLIPPRRGRGKSGNHGATVAASGRGAPLFFPFPPHLQSYCFPASAAFDRQTSFLINYNSPLPDAAFPDPMQADACRGYDCFANGNVSNLRCPPRRPEKVAFWLTSIVPATPPKRAFRGHCSCGRCFAPNHLGQVVRLGQTVDPP